MDIGKLVVYHPVCDFFHILNTPAIELCPCQIHLGKKSLSWLSCFCIDLIYNEWRLFVPFMINMTIFLSIPPFLHLWCNLSGNDSCSKTNRFWFCPRFSRRLVIVHTGWALRHTRNRSATYFFKHARSIMGDRKTFSPSETWPNWANSTQKISGVLQANLLHRFEVEFPFSIWLLRLLKKTYVWRR